jgi:hypothetical protein
MKLIICIVLVASAVLIFLVFRTGTDKSFKDTEPEHTASRTRSNDIANNVSPVKISSVASVSPPKIEQTMQPLTEKELIAKAFSETEKFAEIPTDVIPTVQYKEDVAIIKWPVRRSPDPNLNKPGPEYHALIEINRHTGKIVKALASQD